MKQINIQFDPVGRPTVDTVGFIGKSCKTATEAIEEALAGTGKGNTETEFKPEFNRVEAPQQQTQQLRW